MPDQHGRTLGKRTVAAVAIDAGPQGGAATEESVTIGNGLYLLGRIGGSGVSFLVDTGSGVSILAARKWKEWGRTEDELTRYWGSLCSVEGRALECLGKARLTVTLGTRVVEWGFIVAEIGDDEGILGNDFAMAHELTVRPCEGAVYLPDHAETGRRHLGERLPCTVRVVTKVRTITEETLAVRAVGPATLAPHAITQVRVIVPTPWACGTVMVDRGPGPLGLCPVRGIVEVEQASNIWLANPGSQPIQLDGDEVVALAECVLAGPGASAGSDRDIGDEVNGLVERASPHLTREECRQLQMAMAARKHLFAKGKGDLGRTDIVQHRIHTGDQPAIKQRVRRYPAARREEERQLVEDMLAIGIIQESNSAWSSPTVLVKKKDGTTRFCIDYRRLNQATKVDAYPLPHIEDSLNTLGGARFFCSLDLASGYWQVEMDAAVREKTAFVTQGGLYEFRVMPFGLVNAPATFERLMERVLRGIAWSECLVYLDDILVFGPDFGTTLARLEKVLDRLGEAGLKLKAKKCQLFQEEIPFLGHIVSAAGIGADPTKCQQVRDWPVSRDLHEVRSFVGLCSYYRRHIQGFTELAAPLYELATKGTEFEWTDRRHEAFGQLKNALTSAPILGFPREDGLWYLDTDASDVGTGAVLSQVQDEEERVIAYVSKSLEGSKQRYCTARKELLAVVRALKHFKCYLYGQKITVRTDNSAVSWLHRSKDPVGQPARWIEVIDTYDITFQHRPGRKHGNADALSRYPCRQCGGDCEGANQQEQVPCPKCGKHVQRRNLKKYQRSQHDGVRRRRHACPFCKPGVHKTYSYFQDWKNHLHTTHDQCLEDDDPLDREEYAAGFKLDLWERFHHIEGDETDRAYQRIATLRKHYGPYQGEVKGEPPGTPSTIRIPHTKGMTPDREVVPAESEFAGSDQEGSDQEEGEITQTEGEGSGTFTQMRPRDSDSGSESTKEPAADQECGAGPTETSPYYKRRQKDGSFTVS